MKEIELLLLLTHRAYLRPGAFLRAEGGGQVACLLRAACAMQLCLWSLRAIRTVWERLDFVKKLLG
jgi:hypothetical protein